MPLISWIYRALVLLFVATVLGMAFIAEAQVPGDPRQEALFGTYTRSPVHTPVLNPMVHPYAPHTSVGPVVTFPLSQREILDWRHLRLERLSQLTEALSERIYFAFDSTVLEDDALVAIGELATLLQENPDVGLSLAGHTDLVGTDEYNDLLSNERAEIVQVSLSRLGVEIERLKLSFYGEHRPVVRTEDKERLNRRVEIELFSLF